jgi:hypothetical protein
MISKIIEQSKIHYPDGSDMALLKREIFNAGGTFAYDEMKEIYMAHIRQLEMEKKELSRLLGVYKEANKTIRELLTHIHHLESGTVVSPPPPPKEFEY